MSAPEEQDHTYAEASPKALGRMLAGMLSGMIEGGMDHDDAMKILSDYTWAIAANASREQGDEAQG